MKWSWDFGFDISPCARVGKKNENYWGMFATPHTEDIMSQPAPFDDEVISLLIIKEIRRQVVDSFFCLQ